MKFACSFINPVTGKRREVVVDLAAHEIADAHRSPEPELFEEAYALTHAYALIGTTADGEDFRHLAGGIRRLVLN